MHHTLFSKEKRQWFVVICWLIAALMCVVYLPYADKPFKIDNINDPKAESTIAQKTMEKQFPYSGSSVIVLYKSAKLTANNPRFVAEVNESLSGLKKLKFAHRVISPYKNSHQISDNKHVAYAVIETDIKAETLANSMDDIRKALDKPKLLTMYVGGEPAYTADVNRLSEENLRRGEMIALPICFIAMIFVFSGILPALLTIFTGVINITIIITIVYLLGHQMDLTVFVLNIATMLGLGLSLDYTLLITYRFREEYAKHHDAALATLITLSTAGKSVFFSGLIVLISIASLVFFPINILYSIGIGGIVVVVVTIFSSVTFLPAMLCLFEKYVTKTNVRLKHISSESVHHHRWFKFAMLVMKYPFTFMIPTILILLLLGYPFLNVKINSSDAKILPTWAQSRQVLDQFDENFNANELTPINVVLTAKNKSILSKANIGALDDYAKHLKKDSRVNRVISIVTIKSGVTKQQYQQIYSSTHLPFDEYQKQMFKSMAKGKYTLMSIISNYSKDDKRNFELIDTIRKQKVGNGITKLVGGQSAEIIDTMDIVYSLFLKVVIFISVFTYIVLFLLLRSIILPLKAILMNFLSLSVCYGMLVFIFQEGHMAKFFHFQALGFTDLNLPILLFFVLFGLSMDYEVFLLTRIKEFYERTGDNTKSVAYGLERSARIITSAALIMVIVTGAFVTADIVFIKEFGLGAALAIAIDASLIRLLLVPSTMCLLGDWNWYLPKWLDRRMPDLHFDKELPDSVPKSKRKA
jgi:putative drug exporter of the RND superfamily